jgi:hypothetical protein
MKLDAFSIPIFTDTLNWAVGSGFNQRLWDDVITHKKMQNRSGKNVKQTNVGLEEEYASFKELASVISIWARKTVKEAGTTLHNGSARSFWANYNNTPHAFHMPHAHTLEGFMWTGVYFPKGKTDVFLESSNIPRPGSLVLMDPLGPMKTSCATVDTKLYPYWGNPICIQPRESSVVLFPSYLPHMVTPTETGEERMSIAFSVSN